MESGVVPPRGASSNSGSDADWEPEEPILKQRSSTSEDSKLRVREKGKTAQQKWLQKYKVGPQIPPIILKILLG
jgi:hypothetical protein